MNKPKINALFQFIEFLYSNIENFEQCNNTINELHFLDMERKKVTPRKNFADKLKYDDLQEQIKNKFKVIQDNILIPIQTKAIELNICDLNKTETLWNWNINEINELKENFSKDDLPEILKYKNKYIEYRTKTKGEAFFGLSFFFNDLDKTLKNLFSFFNETDKNDFETFETKAIKVNSIEEAIQIFTNKEHKDERFWLNSFFDKQEQTNPIYKSYKYQIENNGCFIIKTKTDTVKIYTPELAVILISNELSARNMETQTETTINGSYYLNSYIEGYKEGEQDFEKEFKVSANTLYGENAEQYVRDIHSNFFHVQHTGANEGWSYVKNNFPIVLTYKVVKEYGYYSGIVNKVEEQVKKYPKLFATFDKCEHNLPPQPINSGTDTEKIRTKHYVLAYLFECNAKGESYPIGNKKDLESIGNKRMGEGKGNTFYKVFNKIVMKDLNVENNLIEIGGEYWRKAVIELTEVPELVEKYLQNKQL